MCGRDKRMKGVEVEKWKTVKCVEEMKELKPNEVSGRGERVTGK